MHKDTNIRDLELSIINKIGLNVTIQNNKDNKGKIVFEYGENVPFIKANHIMTPFEKDIHFFPAKLKHSVYPFKSNVERISISGNFFTPRRDWQLY